jgi:hypothetical protein
VISQVSRKHSGQHTFDVAASRNEEGLIHKRERVICKRIDDIAQDEYIANRPSRVMP